VTGWGQGGIVGEFSCCYSAHLLGGYKYQEIQQTGRGIKMSPIKNHDERTTYHFFSRSKRKCNLLSGKQEGAKEGSKEMP
jgi:hypothetical protein